MRVAIDTRGHAFSLIELLVCLGILTVLLGLIFPIVNQIRAAASAVQCENNLHQIGIALLHHHDAYGVLPHNGGWDGKQQIKATDGSLFTPSTYDNSLRTNFFWGVGEPGLLPTAQTGPWSFSILPFLDQSEIYQKRDWTQPITTYICPARRVPVAYDVSPSDAHGRYNGGGWKWGKTDYASNAYLIGARPKCYRLIEITDGASNTLMVGEKAFDGQVQMPSSWYYDEAFFLGGSEGTARRGLEVLADGNGIGFKHNWGSAHPGTANFLFADGAVRKIAIETPWSIMAPQLGPNDGDILPLEGG